MSNPAHPCAIVSLRDVELEGQISCARRRLVVIAPGISGSVAKAIVTKWRELGAGCVQVVLDADPEVCCLGLGDFEAMDELQKAARQIGGRIYCQPGIRVGIVITDETITVYSPTPRLIEAGGQPGERLNALRFDNPGPEATLGPNGFNLHSIDLQPTPLKQNDVLDAKRALDVNPPMKFDLARRVRVFNARFEFVEFELRGLSLSRKRVPIPSDMMGLAKDPKTQRLLRSSFQLIGEDAELSGDRVMKLKQFIAKTNLINLPGYGTVILRINKERFQVAVKALQRYVHRFQQRLKKKLQQAIDSNREILIATLLPSITKSPPTRWNKFLGDHPTNQAIEEMLRVELIGAFGQSEDLFEEMSVRVIFKGITYELLSDPEFMRVAAREFRSLGALHEEFDAAAAKAHSNSP